MLRSISISLCTLLAASFLSSCNEEGMSYNVDMGPENTLMAPLFDSVNNKQFHKDNAKLYSRAVADSAFYAKRRQAMNTLSDSASKPTDTAATGKDSAAAANAPVLSADEHK